MSTTSDTRDNSNQAAAAPSTRPLTARSVLASTLLGVTPPRLATRVLVRSGELFGISPSATRTALSRMSSAGEVVADGEGYRLAGHLAERRIRQDRSRLGATERWDGTWLMAVVVEGRRSAADRAVFRASARLARLAELREGLWCRPDNLGDGRVGNGDVEFGGATAAARPGSLGGMGGQCRWFRGASPVGSVGGVGTVEEASRLAAELWKLDGWADDARTLIARLEQLRPQLADEQLEVLPDAFVTSASALRHLGSDPLLPPELLGAEWPGSELRRAHQTFGDAFNAAWRRWHRREVTPDWR